MDWEFIQSNNEVVGKNDFIIHVGDFTIKRGDNAQQGNIKNVIKWVALLEFIRIPN